MHRAFGQQVVKHFYQKVKTLVLKKYCIVCNLRRVSVIRSDERMVQRLIRRDSFHISHSHRLVSFLSDVFRHSWTFMWEITGRHVSGPPPPPSPPHSPPDLTISIGPACSLLISVLTLLFLYGEKSFSTCGNRLKLQRDPVAEEKIATCFQHFGPPSPTLQYKVTVDYGYATSGKRAIHNDRNTPDQSLMHTLRYR